MTESILGNILLKIIGAGRDRTKGILDTIPAGISIAADASCKEVIHNSKAAEFLRIKTLENLSITTEENQPVKLIHNGRELTPAEMPLKRSAWKGEEVTGFEIEFIWDDGVHKTMLANASPLFDESSSIIGAIASFEDITTRKELERSLLEKEQECHLKETLLERDECLKALMDYNPALIFLKDECGRYVYLNETYEKMFVRSRDWYGKTDFDFWSKESAELFRANDLAVLETGLVTQYLEDSKDLDGTRYCWLNYKFPYTDSKNRRYSGGIGIDVTKRILAEEALRKVTSMYIIHADITERKQMEQSLRESEERRAFLLKLSDAIRPLGDPVAILETASRLTGEHFGATQVIYAEIDRDNPDIVLVARGLAHSGVPSVAGRYFMDDFGVFVAQLLRAGLPVIVEDAANDPRISPEELRNWELVNTLASISLPLIKDGRLVACLTVYRDQPHHWTEGEAELLIGIAERTWTAVERARAEEALRASEEKFRSFIEMAGEGIAESDTEGRIVFVNKRLADMLGYTQDELLGRIGLEFMAEDNVQQAYEDREGLVDNIHVDREYKLRHKGGSIVRTLCNATPLYDAGGQYLGSLAMHSDITRRKQVEEEKRILSNALQIERDRLSVLISNIPDEIWFTDSGGNIILTNQATLGEFNTNYRGVNAAEIVASLEIYRPDGSPRPVDETPLLRAIKGEKILNLEEIIRTPANNELRHRQVSAVPVCDNGGNIIGAVAITRDTNEQKRAEKEYAMSRLHKISTLYVNNGDLAAILNEVLELAISFTGADMGNIQLLEAESGLLRIMAHRGFGHPFLDFFAVVDHGTGTCGTALNRCERVIVEDVTRSPIFAGTPALDVLLEAGVRAVQSTPLVSRSGILVGMLSTHFRSPHIPEEHDLQLVDLLVHQAADLIERKKSEEALRQSEEHFSMIFNNSPDMISIIDMETDRFVDVNRRFTEVLGYTREEVVGRALQELNYLTDSRQHGQKHKNSNLTGSETVLRSKSGRLINVLFSAGVAEIGRKKQRITIFKDITKLKEMEFEITRLDRLNLVGEMAAGIGHEVRNPMTTVRGFLQLLGEKERYAGDREFFELMIEELDWANSIISEFLSLARNKAVDLEKKDLNKILKAILPLIQADGLVTDKYVDLKTGKTPELLIDEKEIRQLVLNLVRNGLQAMEPGKTLTLRTFMDEDNVVLAVKDQGQGIPDEIIDKLGTPFFTTKYTGTGLGLAVCYSIAARHGARIEYETSAEGTTFYVRFSTAAGQHLPEMGKTGRGGGSGLSRITRRK